MRVNGGTTSVIPAPTSSAVAHTSAMRYLYVAAKVGAESF